MQQWKNLENNYSNKMNILITSAGQRVSLVRAFQYEMRNHNIQGEVYTTDMHPALSAACNVSDKFFQVERVTDKSYIKSLLAICIENNVKMIVPTIDTELLVLAENKEYFTRYNINIIISSLDLIVVCRDKRKSNLLFEEHSIRIPTPININKPSFPLFIKPYDGSLSSNIHIIKNEDELTQSHVENPKNMFMEFIDTTIYNEYTVDMYYGKDNHVKSIIPRKRIAVRAGEILKGLTCKNYIVDYLRERLEYVEGAFGCLTLQLFYNEENNDIVGIEINPRFGGGFPLSYSAGGNYPGWLIEEYLLNKSIKYFSEWEDNLLMLRYDNEVLVHDFKS